MCDSEYTILLSAHDAEISAALLAYETAFNTGDRREILRTWERHKNLLAGRNRFIETARRLQQVA